MRNRVISNEVRDPLHLSASVYSVTPRGCAEGTRETETKAALLRRSPKGAPQAVATP